MKTDRIKELLTNENAHLKKLNDIVLAAVEDEKLLSEKLYSFEETHISLTGRMADSVASFGGSWKFISSFIFIMLIWIVINIFLLSKPFDPYPFILLNLLLSTIAALQAPIIMMSQNRKEEKDRQRAINDYLINLKAEIEVRNLHQKMDLLISEQMQTLFDIQKAQFELMEETRELIKRKQGSA
ncbi:MAG: DUF1003 domain-containing protein [Sediminibacterium sp.]